MPFSFCYTDISNNRDPSQVIGLTALVFLQNLFADYTNLANSVFRVIAGFSRSLPLEAAV
ncbi:MAG: hypothetical protein CL608_01375 [Anaerolineaceae bacterium]|nr:hypothetical protein [Anaerolineaceae bacterium]